MGDLIVDAALSRLDLLEAYEHAVRVFPLGVVVVAELNGRIYASSRTFTDWLGYSEHGVTGSQIFDLVVDDDVEVTRIEYARSLTTGADLDHAFVNRYWTRFEEERRRWARLKWLPIRGGTENERTVGVCELLNYEREGTPR